MGSRFRAVDSGFRAVDSGFRAVDSGFFVSDTWIPDSMNCIPDSNPRIRVSTSKNFPDSGIPILLHEAIDFSGLDGRFLSIYIQHKWRVILQFFPPIFLPETPAFLRVNGLKTRFTPL